MKEKFKKCLTKQRVLRKIEKKTNRNTVVEKYNNRNKNSLEGLLSKFDLAEESVNLELGQQ